MELNGPRLDQRGSGARREGWIPVFVDSPLAVNVTEAFRKHTDYLDSLPGEWWRSVRIPHADLREASESKKLNDLHGAVCNYLGDGNVRGSI